MFPTGSWASACPPPPAGGAGVWNLWDVEPQRGLGGVGQRKEGLRVNRLVPLSAYPLYLNWGPQAPDARPPPPGGRCPLKL